MSSHQAVYRIWNRRVLIVFVLELILWGIWSQTLMRAPFESLLVRPVMEASTVVGQVLFGCNSLACIPFVFAGVVLYLYVVAVLITNIYDWVTAQALGKSA